MNTNVFVAKLAEMAPEIDDLHKGKQSLKRALEIRESYFVKKIKNEQLYSDPLLNLISNYDCRFSYLDFTFYLNQKSEYENKIRFGAWEGDPVYINTLTGELEQINYYIPGQILYYIAKNSEHFLEVMLVCLRPDHLKLHSYDPITVKNFRRNKAIEAAAAAGGDKYLPFYLINYGLA